MSQRGWRARSRQAIRSPSCCPRCPAPPTSLLPGARRWRRCMTRANMTRWWRPASRSPPGCWPLRCRNAASRPGPGRAGRSRSRPTAPMAAPASPASTAPRSSAAWWPGKSRSYPAFRESAPTIASPRSAAAAPIPRPWPSRPRFRPTDAISTPMSTASTPPIRASCRAPGNSTASPMRRCWSLPRSVPRCFRHAAWNWR